MTADERTTALRAKHADLESAIEEENHRPRPDNDAISAMKREKLRIKDELAGLQYTSA